MRSSPSGSFSAAPREPSDADRSAAVFFLMEMLIPYCFHRYD
uniref:Uncharacterized protein n=1 Tax=Arundo donax TaxID=35708 RepID=A0A0A8ZTY5_ARUDO